jgi:hypothetical protein
MLIPDFGVETPVRTLITPEIKRPQPHPQKTIPTVGTIDGKHLSRSVRPVWRSEEPHLQTSQASGFVLFFERKYRLALSSRLSRPKVRAEAELQ